MDGCRSGWLRLDLISIGVLTMVVATLNATLQVPRRSLALTEEHEERGETYGTDALRFQLMKMRDASGRIPVNAYGHAKSQVDLMKWGGAARRIEHADPPPVSPEMFSALAPASAAGAPLISPKSWRWLGPGNVGGRIRSIVIHPKTPDTMFAGSVGGGIWKTTNGGTGWTPIDDFMAALSVSSLVINPANPSVMFAGTGEGYGNADSLRGAGIFKSVDGGTTWTQLPETAANFSMVTRLAISPNGTVVLAGTNTGIWRSTNASTFTWINTGITPQDLDVSPSDSRKAVASGYGTIAYSWDSGLTWQRSTGLPSTSGRIEVAYARSQPDTIYALVDDSGGTLYRSADAGATFSAVSATPLLDNGQGWYDEALWVNPRDSNHVVAGGVYLRQTFDGGRTWQWISDNVHVDQHVIVEDPRYDDAGNRTVFFGNDGGVYKTTNIRNVAADGYTALNNNLGVTQFYGAAGNVTSGTIVGGTQDNGTVFHEPRHGTKWYQSLGSDGGFVASDPTDPSYFYAEMIYLQIHRSEDGGAAWTSITSGLTDAYQSANFIAPFVLDPNDPNRMLAGGSRVWRSTNIKSSSPAWTPITVANASNYVSALAVAPGQSDVVWVGYNMGQVHRSTNAAAATPRFSPVKAPTLGNFVSRITISASDSNVVYVSTGSFGPTNIIKTVNGGVTWSDATGAGATGLPDVPVNDLEIDPSNPDTIYAGTDVGVFVSLDGGATWDLPQDGPANVSVDELFWMGATLVAATHGRGMFAADSMGAAPPKAVASPALLDFGSPAVSSQSAPQRVRISNSGGSPLTIYSLSIDGAHDYSIAESTCSGTLPLGATCWIDTVFGPRAEGPRVASLVLVTNASNSELAIPLRGAGAAATAPRPLPAPWTSEDVGQTGVAGAAGISNGTVTVSGGGADIWDAADAFQFVHQPLAGDGTIVARVATIQNLHAWTKAGIMIRDGVSAAAPNAALIVSAQKGVSFQHRTTAGGLSANQPAAGAAPRWVKLTRIGNVITASTSIDSATWAEVGQVTIAMASTVEVGLVVSSHEVSKLASATFDNVSVTPAAAVALPAGWRTTDVGAVGKTGRASEAGGTFTIAGAGDDIWGASDAFRFASIQLQGNGTVVARVAKVENVNAWTKAGVMIRQSLDVGAAHASLFVTPAKGVAFQRRASSGGATIDSRIAGAAPRFVKLVRAGPIITASVSIDGRGWTSVGQQTLAIAGPVWAGLAVSSHDATRLASVTFDQVAVAAATTLPAGWQDVDLGDVGVPGSASAADGVFTVDGSGADIWGAADAFHFAHRTLRGDGEMIARVADVRNTHRWAKAGVMIRQTASPSSAFAMMIVSAASGTAFQYRTIAGGSAESVAGTPAAAPPQWVKIVRAGTKISGYQSSDGISWKGVGTATIALDSSTDVGLVVTSHDNATLGKATFDHVRP